MSRPEIATGVVHEVPQDIEDALIAEPALLEKWNCLTPLARNEWICWTTIVKKPETRANHVAHLRAEILEGKNRPCCWPGCPRRSDSARKWFESRKKTAQLPFLMTLFSRASSLVAGGCLLRA